MKSIGTSGIQRNVWVIFQALLLCLMFAFVTVSSADASSHRKRDRCSAEGQKPCPIAYKGPICDAGLGNIRGTCRKCGGEGQYSCPPSKKGKQCSGGRMKIDGRCYKYCGGPNQKACKKSKRGYPCKGGYEANQAGFCKPCGGLNQKACRALKKGKQCQSSLTKIDGRCLNCGGEGQRACPVLKSGKQCSGDRMKIDGRCYAECGGPNQKACKKSKRGYPCKGSYEPNQAGFCKPCGGLNQKACRALKQGKQCQSSLTKIDGRCLNCGGEGQRACPVLKSGKQCSGGRMKIDGRCYAECGGPDQKACKKIKRGYPCKGSYEPNQAGFCKPCGGLNQKACRVLKKGRQCAVGSTERGGICVKCGGVGERACKVTDKGRQCGVGTTERGGVCVPCGGEGQRACKITDKGKACQAGLKRGLNGICKITKAERVRRSAMVELKNRGGSVAALTIFADQNRGNSSLKSQVRNQDVTGGDEIPDNKACLGKFASWTLGVGGEVGAIVSVEGEVGGAFRCGQHSSGNKDAKFYSSGSLNFHAGGGATAAVTFGMWVDDFNRLRGKSHGYVLDLVDAAQSVVALANPSALAPSMAEPDIAVGVWFERRDEDGDEKEDEVGRFLGFTISVGAAAGLDLGGTYVKATTVQFCTIELKCTEGSWAGEIDAEDVTMFIDGQTKKSIQVSIDGGEPVKYTRATKAGRKYENEAGDIIRFRKNFKIIKFETAGGAKSELVPVATTSAEGTWTGQIEGVDTTIFIDGQFKLRTKVKGGPDEKVELFFAKINDGPRVKFNRKNFGRGKWENDDGDTIDFKKNWSILKFKRQNGDKGEFTLGSDEDIALAPTAINVLGPWEFEVNGRILTDEFIEQSSGRIVVRREGTTLERTFDKVEGNENEYTSEFGGTFRFVSDTRAVWISPPEGADGSVTVFRYRRP